MRVLNVVEERVVTWMMVQDTWVDFNTIRKETKVSRGLQAVLDGLVKEGVLERSEKGFGLVKDRPSKCSHPVVVWRMGPLLVESLTGQRVLYCPCCDIYLLETYESGELTGTEILREMPVSGEF